MERLSGHKVIKEQKGRLFERYCTFVNLSKLRENKISLYDWLAIISFYFSLHYRATLKPYQNEQG